MGKGKGWFKVHRTIKNPVSLWFPVNGTVAPGEWDFDVVAVGWDVILAMGGCDCCGCRRSRVIYVLVDEDNLLCQRCFFEWLDHIEGQAGAAHLSDAALIPAQSV